MAIDWNTVIFNMLTIKGIYGREMYETWYKMQSMIQSGLDISPVITHRFHYTEFEKAFEVMGSGNSGKVDPGLGRSEGSLAMRLGAPHEGDHGVSPRRQRNTDVGAGLRARPSGRPRRGRPRSVAPTISAIADVGAGLRARPRDGRLEGDHGVSPRRYHPPRPVTSSRSRL